MPAASDLAGLLRAGSAESTADAVTRTHLSDGRVVGWYGPPEPGVRVAIDAEIAAQAVPPSLARRFGAEDFWVRWTAAECAAKLADVPILLWIRTHGLDPAPYVVETVRLDDLVVSVARPGAVVPDAPVGY